MKYLHCLLAGLLTLTVGGRLTAQPLTNPIDIANEVERLRAENQVLEDELDPLAELALLRKENTDLKTRLSGPQTLADLKAATAQLLEKQPAFVVTRRGPAAETIAALLRTCADPNDPRHAQALKSLFTARLVIARLLDDTTAQLAMLPPARGHEEISGRQSFAAKLASAKQMCADVGASPNAAKEDWRYPIRDLLSALQ